MSYNSNVNLEGYRIQNWRRAIEEKPKIVFLYSFLFTLFFYTRFGPTMADKVRWTSYRKISTWIKYGEDKNCWIFC